MCQRAARRRPAGVVAGTLIGASIVVGLLLVSNAAAARAGEIAVVESSTASQTAGGHSSIVLIPSDRAATASNTKVLVRGPGEISHLQWTRGGKMLVYDEAINEDGGGPTHVYVVDVASGKRRLLVANLTGTDRDALSPDGKTLAYTQGLLQTVAYLVGIDGRSRRKLYPGSDPSWSSDGSRIALDTPTASGDRVITVASDGSGKKLLYTTPDAVESVAWAPDDKSVLLETLDVAKAALGNPGSSSIETLSRSGVVLHVLSDATDDAGSYSPDGTRVVIEQVPKNADGPPSIIVVNADGSDRHTIDTTRGDGTDIAFSWSPDGGSIVTSEEFQGIRVVRADGTHAQVLDAPVGAGRLTAPTWRPAS
jgi:Tol biopolymer transport system component